MFSELEIDVITSTKPNQKTIEDFLDLGPEKSVKTDLGSLLAWLGHLELLRSMVASGLVTALIVEDDVDWDVVVKSQMFR